MIVQTTEHVNLTDLLLCFSLKGIFTKESHLPISHKLHEFQVLMEIFRMTWMLRMQGEFKMIQFILMFALKASETHCIQQSQHITLNSEDALMSLPSL
jgi:hypothetical protein